MLSPLLSFTLCFDEHPIYPNREMIGLVQRNLGALHFPAQLVFNGTPIARVRFRVVTAVIRPVCGSSSLRSSAARR